MLKAGTHDVIPSQLKTSHPVEWRRSNSNSPDSDMPEDLGDEGIAEEVDTIARHIFTKEMQTQAMSELSYHQPNEPFQQDHAPRYPQSS